MADERKRLETPAARWAVLFSVPSPRWLGRYPLTAAVGLAAVVTTVLWWVSGQGAWATMNRLAFSTQPWRLLSSTLVHSDLLHLGFNLYWLWFFGTRLESVLGAWRLAALMLLLVVASSAAEYALFVGGVGLSGLGYGLFAFAWALARRDPRCAARVPRPVVILLVSWFFVCIALTALHATPLANGAHAAGAALGGLLGLACASRRHARYGYGVAAALCSLALLLAASVGRPFVNLHHGANKAARQAERAPR